VKNDRVLLDGKEYSLGQSGFARRSGFKVMSGDEKSCRLTLRSGASTLQHYPFDFELEVAYRIEGSRLRIEATVLNTGQRVMPASFGFHPAFRWPLPYGGPRDAHEIRFEQAETEPLRPLVNGLLGPVASQSPVDGTILRLWDDLFNEDALVFELLASRAVEYGAPGRRLIKVAFPDMPHLGIWTKLDADFICIEPWQGFASPVELDGELAEKPGVVPVDPGIARRFSMEISVSL